MDKKNSSNINLIIMLVILIFMLGGYIIYDKLLRGNNIESGEKTTESSIKGQEETNVISDMEIKDLLSLVIIKRNSSDTIHNYKISELTDKDINDIICSYIVETVDSENDAGLAFQMDAEALEKTLKNIYGIDSGKINVKAGMNNYGMHNLSVVDNNGTKYYRVERKDGIPMDVPNDDLYDYGSSYKVSYKNGELSIQCGVIHWETESPYYELLGNATIKFNISNGIKFVSFDFNEASSKDMYSASPIME